MKISHNLLFLFGSVYYLLTPFIVGNYGFFYEMPGMSNWYSDYEKISNTKFQIYFAYVFGIFVMFYTGSLLFSKVSLNIKRIDSLLYPGKFLGGFFSIIMFFAILFIFINNIDIAFSGYKETYNKRLLGMVGTFNVLITFLCVHSLLSKMQRSLYFYFLLFSLFLSTVFLLGLGSRMYVIIPLIALLIYKINYSAKPIRLLTIFMLGSALLFIMLSVGAWRVGYDLNYAIFVFIFLAEPIFTSWSTATFLQIENLPIITEPLNYMSSFINFIPSSVFPGKADYIYNISDSYNYRSPLGAASIFVSTAGNFGVLFGSFFFFLLGGFLSFLRNLSKNSKFFTAYYILILSVIPFQLFRDDFAIINKQLYWNMFVLPFVCLFFLCLLRIFLIASYSRKSRI